MNDLNVAKTKSTTVTGLIIGALILMVLAVMVYTRSGSILPTVMVSDGNRIDRLFYEMGVLKIPNIAPPMDIILKDLDGKTVKVSDLKGKIVFLNFWTTWCPACRVEMPSMERLHKRLADKDFAMVAISMQESATQVSTFFKEYRLSFISLLDSDGDVSSRFGAFSVPTTYILGKDGGIIGRAVGAREWDSKEAIALFEHLIDKGMEPSLQAPDI